MYVYSVVEYSIQDEISLNAVITRIYIYHDHVGLFSVCQFGIQLYIFEAVRCHLFYILWLFIFTAFGSVGLRYVPLWPACNCCTVFAVSVFIKATIHSYANHMSGGQTFNKHEK